jgi:hypothetical protein
MPSLLLTSRIDAERYPAGELVDIYHERWEIEGAYDEIKTHMLAREETIRSRTPVGVRQEVWGIALAFNLIRLEMERAANELGVAPTRISFVNALALIKYAWVASSDHLELVQNGKVIRRFDLKGDRKRYDSSGTIELAEAGWVVLRAWNDDAHQDVLDLYPYATTSPIYLDGASPPPAPADAAYFVAWMDRVIEAAGARGDWNNDDERRRTLEYLGSARDKFLALAAPTRK